MQRVSGMEGLYQWHGKKKNIYSIRNHLCVLVCNTLSTFYLKMIEILDLKLQNVSKGIIPTIV